MPSAEQLDQFYNAYLEDGGTREQAIAYMRERGWIRPKRSVTDERSEMALYGASPQKVEMLRQPMTGMEKFSAYVGEENVGYGYDTAVYESRLNLPYGAEEAIPSPFRGGMAATAAAFHPVPEGSPQWRQDLRMTHEQAMEESTPAQKGLYFGGSVLIDLLVGSKGKMLTKPLSIGAKKLAGRVLGDDFVREGFLTSSMLDDAFSETLVEEIADQTSQLGASISEELLRGKYVNRQMAKLRSARNIAMREFEDAATVAEKQYLNRYSALAARWADQFEQAKGSLRTNVRETTEVRPANEASFLDVAGDLAEPPITRAVGKETPIDAIKTRFQDPRVQNALRAEDISPRGTVEDPFPRGGVSRDPLVTESVPLARATAGNESALLEIFERGFQSEALKLRRSLDDTLDVIKKTRKEALADMNQEDWLRAAKESVSPEKLANWRKQVQGKRAREVKKATETAMYIARREARLSDDTKDLYGVLAMNAATNPALLTDEGIEAAKILDGNNSGLMHSFLKYVRRQFTGGVQAEFNEGALTELVNLSADPRSKEFYKNTLPKLYEKYKGRLSARLFQMSNARQELSTAISNYSRFSGKSVQDVGRMLTKHREAGRYIDIPDTELRNAAAYSQAQIDEMSKEMLALGMDPKVAESITENLGKYMHLSYANNYIDNWAAMVKDTAAWDGAFKFLVEKYGITVSRPNGMTDSQIRGLMMWLLNKQSGGALDFARGDLPKQYLSVIRDLGVGSRRPRAPSTGLQDLSEFKHKTDMPPEIRELFGVNQDFMLDFDKTSALMLQDLEATHFLRNVLEQGMKSGVIRRQADEGYSALFTFDRISPEDARAFVPPELATVLNGLDAAVEKSGILAMVNGITKAGKIIPSPGTQARNFLSLIPMLMQAGILPFAQGPEHAAKAFKAFSVKTLQKGKMSKDLLRDMTRAHELNLIGTGTLSGEAEIWVQQAAGIMGHKAGRAFVGATPKFAKKGWDLMRRAYTGIDDFGKFYGWQVYRDRLGNQLVKDADDLKFLKDTYGSDNIEEAAANVIKQTLQHFPRTPTLGKTLARNPLVGTFVSFPLEMSRNLVNSVRFASKEIKYGISSGKTRWVVQGASRLAGITAGAFSFAAAGEYSAKKLGLDRHKMEAFRTRALAPWAKNNEIAFMSRKGLKYTFMDMGYANPYSEVLEIVQAAIIRPGPLPEKLERAAEQIEDVLFSNEIAAGALIGAMIPGGGVKLDENILSGLVSKKDARRIVNPQDPDALMEKAYYVFRQMAPGAIVSAERLTESLSGRRAFGWMSEKKRFQSYEPEAEVLALFGVPRIVTVDIGESMKFQMRSLQKEWVEFGSAFAYRLHSAKTIGDQYAVVDKFRADWSKKLDELEEMRRDALELDMSMEQWEELVSRLVADRNLGFRKKTRQALAEGARVDILDVFPYLD